MRRRGTTLRLAQRKYLVLTMVMVAFKEVLYTLCLLIIRIITWQTLLDLISLHKKSGQLSDSFNLMLPEGLLWSQTASAKWGGEYIGHTWSQLCPQQMLAGITEVSRQNLGFWTLSFMTFYNIGPLPSTPCVSSFSRCQLYKWQ